MVLKKYVKKTEFDSYDDFQNNFHINIPECFNFAFDVVDVIAEQTPKKQALLWCNDKGAEHRFTFADMKTQSSKAAHFFKCAGIHKGDKVMLLLKRRYEFWFCLLALHRIGAICIPATHLLTAKDLIYRNNAADVKMIVSDNDADLIRHIENAEKESASLQQKVLVGGSRSGWIDFCSEYDSMPAEYARPQENEAISNNDIMIIYFTSGTTGMPKMVNHNFTYPLGHYVTAKYWQCVQPDKPHLTLAETGWAKALWGKIYGQWLCGSIVFVYDFEKFLPKDLLGILSKHQVATFCAPPTVYRFMLLEDLGNYNLSSLQYCSIAGEAYDQDLYQDFYSATGIKLKEAYGQTETTVVLGNFLWMENKTGSMGKPAPGYQVEVLNSDGTPCETSESGELVIRTSKPAPVGLFDGYYRDQKYTDKMWHEGYYYTGDLVRKDSENYYWFIGRVDNMIKSSGYRISPFEVESVLIEHPAVGECVVTSRPDADRGQAVKAIVVLNEGYTPGPKLVKQLQDYVKAITAPYKYPRFIEFVDELPRVFNGKIKRP